MSRSKEKFTLCNSYSRYNLELSFVAYRNYGLPDDDGTDFLVSTEVDSGALKDVIERFNQSVYLKGLRGCEIRPIYLYVTKQWGVSSFEGPHHTQLLSEKSLDVRRARDDFDSFEVENASSEITRILTKCGYVEEGLFDMDAIRRDEMDDGVRTKHNRKGKSFYPKGRFSRGSF